ncbi:transcription factor bHLH30-like [Triticum dicoccoides]|uniref:transcription factor bHLH30-like n=1 Tax=Triticum dicoccoides TaxID=85692 RepID=UPI00188FAF78|nr:transcription factor bHLH30-like [Triticum dicoccoides]
MVLPTRSGEPEEAEAEVEMDDQRSTPARGARTSRSHSEAERKRRQRINTHLATLRSLLPSASQMDKAALLGEVVRHVRELRGDADGGAVAGVAVPGERDEVGVEEERWDARESAKRVRAWVCCADRPGLMSELGRAVRSVSARAVRAEIATVGGRTRSVLELEAGQAAGASRPALHAALRAVLLSREDELLAVEGYKRQRFSALISQGLGS